MAKFKLSRYIYNAETLMYEQKQEAKWVAPVRILSYSVAVALLVVLYFWFYTSVLGLDLPKTARLKKDNAAWQSKMAVLNHDLDQMDAILAGIEQRDDDVYRSIFGLDPIPQEVKNAGFGGVNRYAYLEPLGGGSLLKTTVKRLDVMTKRAFVQSKSLDEIAVVSKQAETMVSCVPSVPPIMPQPGTYRISSPYGRRNDPVYKGRVAFHEGMDFATHKGNPVYASGDGVVERVRLQRVGYGNEIIIDHGFGYRTRYAHLNSVNVVKGQRVYRGEMIGAVGSTGKSTGPHLHYEVIYKNKTTNPYSFMDLSMLVEEYSAMVAKAAQRRGPIEIVDGGMDDLIEEPEEVEEYAF